MSSPYMRRYGRTSDGTSVHVSRRVSERQETAHVHHWVATYHHAEASTWVTRWLGLAGELAPSYVTAIRSMFEPAAVQLRIFGMASALERFHDERVQSAIDHGFSGGQIRRYRRAAVAAVPTEIQGQVRELLASLGTPSFSAGLAAVIARLPKDWAAELTGSTGSARDTWLQAVKEVRNGTAHAGGREDIDDFDAYVARLAALCESLVFLTATCYLLEAGLAADKLERGLRDTSLFHLARKLRWPEVYAPLA